MKNIHFWISVVLFLAWFFGFMIFDADKEIHFVFLAAVLTVVIKLFKDFKSNT